MADGDNGSLSLGAYLKNRRTRLDPLALGLPAGRRRTPGLRREEVAQRAHISPTWYTWLEQGRGGAPSADVLDRICHALLLTDIEREHVFLLGLGRAPDVRYQPVEGITPRLQGVLDAMPHSPSVIHTATWDVVAWNKAFAVVMTDYALLPPERRNVLRQIFLNPATRAAQLDWESVARFVVAVFRANTVRADAGAAAEALVVELSAQSPEFARMWRDGDVQGPSGGVKRVRHAVLGELALEYSAFAVSGRPELSLLVYNPATAQDAERILDLMRSVKK